MKLSDVTGSLSEYARKGLRETVVVTRQGRPVVAVMPLTKHDDWESVFLATNAKFLPAPDPELHPDALADALAAMPGTPFSSYFGRDEKPRQTGLIRQSVSVRCGRDATKENLRHRVFAALSGARRVVEIRAVGIKDRDRVIIGGEEIDLS